MMRFQSHAGSIEAGSSCGIICTGCPSFNPTLVRLRRACSGGRSSYPSSFNPTLVRLRPRVVRRGFELWNEFQSHAGSIEAKPDWEMLTKFIIGFNPTLVRLRRRGRGDQRVRGLCFNPTLVRLRPGIFWKISLSASAVSIPRWFD